MMSSLSIRDLIQEYNRTCVPSALKSIQGFLRKIDGKTLQPYASTKQLKRHLQLDPKTPMDDQQRYAYLTEMAVNIVCDNINLDLLWDLDRFKDALTSMLIDQFDDLSGDFKKSPKQLLTKWIKLFDSDDQHMSLIVSTLKSCGTDLERMINDFLKEGRVFCHPTPALDDDDELNKEVISLVKDVMLTCDSFSILDDNLVFVLTSLTEIPGFKECTSDQVMKSVRLGTKINPIHTIMNLDGLKRCYINNGNYDEYVRLLNISTQLYCYRGEYKRNDDFKEGPSLSILIKSFPNGFENAAKFCLARFVFSESAGDIGMTSYWLCTKPIEDILDDFDLECFEWNTIALSEVLDQPNDMTSVLH